MPAFFRQILRNRSNLFLKVSAAEPAFFRNSQELIRFFFESLKDSGPDIFRTGNGKTCSPVEDCDEYSRVSIMRTGKQCHPFFENSQPLSQLFSGILRNRSDLFLKFSAAEPAFSGILRNRSDLFLKVSARCAGVFPEFPAHDPFPSILPGIPFCRTSIIPSEIQARITEILTCHAASRISGQEPPVSGRNPGA